MGDIMDEKDRELVLTELQTVFELERCDLFGKQGSKNILSKINRQLNITSFSQLNSLFKEGMFKEIHGRTAKRIRYEKMLHLIRLYRNEISVSDFIKVYNSKALKSEDYILDEFLNSRKATTEKTYFLFHYWSEYRDMPIDDLKTAIIEIDSTEFSEGNKFNCRLIYRKFFSENNVSKKKEGTLNFEEEKLAVFNFNNSKIIANISTTSKRDFPSLKFTHCGYIATPDSDRLISCGIGVLQGVQSLEEAKALCLGPAGNPERDFIMAEVFRKRFLIDSNSEIPIMDSDDRKWFAHNFIKYSSKIKGEYILLHPSSCLKYFYKTLLRLETNGRVTYNGVNGNPYFGRYFIKDENDKMLLTIEFYERKKNNKEFLRHRIPHSFHIIDFDLSKSINSGSCVRYNGKLESFRSISILSRTAPNSENFPTRIFLSKSDNLFDKAKDIYMDQLPPDLKEIVESYLPLA